MVLNGVGSSWRALRPCHTYSEHPQTNEAGAKKIYKKKSNYVLTADEKCCNCTCSEWWDFWHHALSSWGWCDVWTEEKSTCME